MAVPHWDVRRLMHLRSNYVQFVCTIGVGAQTALALFDNVFEKVPLTIYGYVLLKASFW